MEVEATAVTHTWSLTKHPDSVLRLLLAQSSPFSPLRPSGNSQAAIHSERCLPKRCLSPEAGMATALNPVMLRGAAGRPYPRPRTLGIILPAPLFSAAVALERPPGSTERIPPSVSKRARQGPARSSDAGLLLSFSPTRQELKRSDVWLPSAGAAHRSGVARVPDLPVWPHRRDHRGRLAM